MDGLRGTHLVVARWPFVPTRDEAMIAIRGQVIRLQSFKK